MADRNKAAIDDLLADLARARIGTTFNQFREVGSDDVPEAPAIRLANLRHYLDERAAADIVAVGEAAGYQGMRWSGIAFTSEVDCLRWGEPYRRTSKRPRPWKEPSGTIVHRLLNEVGAEHRVVLWNTVPMHPHEAGKALSNRHPTVDEVAGGRVFAERVLEVIRPRLVIAVGRVAEAALADRGPRYVRHPAQSGATAFREAMRSLLTDPGG